MNGVGVQIYLIAKDATTTAAPVHLGKPGGFWDKAYQQQQELLDVFGGNVTELYESKDSETLSAFLSILPESKAAVDRALQEEAYKAFISYSNHRYQHCWNVTTEIPPYVYADVVKCSATALKSGFEAFNKTIETLVGIGDFLNDTVSRLNECKQYLKSSKPGIKDPVSDAGRVKRSLKTFKLQGKRVVEKGAYYAKKVGTTLVRYATIVGKTVKERALRLKNYMEAKYNKMRTRMTLTARRVLERFKPIGQRTLKVAKVTAKYIQTFYCYANTAYEVYTNASTIVEDFIDSYDVLAKTKDEVRDCVSEKIDKFQGVMCSSGIPNYTDMEEMEDYYDFHTFDDEL